MQEIVRGYTGEVDHTLSGRRSCSNYQHLSQLLLQVLDGFQTPALGPSPLGALELSLPRDHRKSTSLLGDGKEAWVFSPIYPGNSERVEGVELWKLATPAVPPCLQHLRSAHNCL